MLTERHRQKNWRQEDIGTASTSRGWGTEQRDAEAQTRRGIEADGLRGRILELEAVNRGLTTQSAEAESRRGVEANRLTGRISELEAVNNGLRGRNSQLEMANRGLTANVHELGRTATAQAIEKLILEDRTEHLEATLATRNRQNLPNHVSMLEAAIISMQEENTRFDEGTVGVSESVVRELVEINGERNDRWALSQDVLRGNDSDHRGDASSGWITGE
ncbi:hypothetical protein BHYA_0036g00590 [Botrytis hyacinthi]|uniref:Uncharacterized protein n=1 Tax=Botrytis hyacinthi TaxID=278943 RepID=A0A4Z1GUE6_9HELO|nr:hypothetical protein BHYA_0036g00590 [Botrytis hyacinthi]